MISGILRSEVLEIPTSRAPLVAPQYPQDLLIYKDVGFPVNVWEEKRSFDFLLLLLLPGRDSKSRFLVISASLFKDWLAPRLYATKWASPILIVDKKLLNVQDRNPKYREKTEECLLYSFPHQDIWAITLIDTPEGSTKTMVSFSAATARYENDHKNNLSGNQANKISHWTLNLICCVFTVNCFATGRLLCSSSWFLIAIILSFGILQPVFLHCLWQLNVKIQAHRKSLQLRFGMRSTAGHQPCSAAAGRGDYQCGVGPKPDPHSHLR